MVIPVSIVFLVQSLDKVAYRMYKRQPVSLSVRRGARVSMITLIAILNYSHIPSQVCSVCSGRSCLVYRAFLTGAGRSQKPNPTLLRPTSAPSFPFLHVRLTAFT